MLLYRHARPEDEGGLGLLGAELMRQHHEMDPGRFMGSPPDVERGYGRWLVKEAARPRAIVWVATEADVVVGYAYATIEAHDWNMLLEEHAKLHDLLVAETARKRGIARELLVRMRAELVERGCPRVILDTATNNEAAQRLFASLGFRPTMTEMTWNA